VSRLPSEWATRGSVNIAVNQTFRALRCAEPGSRQWLGLQSKLQDLLDVPTWPVVCDPRRPVSAAIAASPERLEHHHEACRRWVALERRLGLPATRP
jgi:hypothetical protein